MSLPVAYANAQSYQ